MTQSRAVVATIAGVRFDLVDANAVLVIGISTGMTIAMNNGPFGLALALSVVYVAIYVGGRAFLRRHR